MMEKDWRELFHDGELAVLTLLRWVVIGGLTGLACGLAGGAFSRVLSWVTQTRQANPWLIFCLPVAGLLIVWSYQALDMANDSGTNQIIASVRSGERPRLRLALLIFFSTALTHLTGGSAGREGAALQIGGSLAAALGKWLRLNERNMNLIVLCGMSALFTALFGTPVAATVFSLEVVSVGILHYSALFPGLFASLVSLGVTRWMGLRGEGWTLLGMPELSPLAVLQVGGLAIACALVAILFCVVMHGSARLYQRVLPNPYLRVLAGAALVIVGVVYVAHGLLTTVDPDYTVAVVTADALPDEAVQRLQTALADYAEDANGDGAVVVQVNNYTWSANASLTDMNGQMAGATQMNTDLANGESKIWILEDPEGFEQAYGALSEKLGTDWQTKLIPWSDLPALSALELGSYATAADGSQTVDVQSRFAGYSVAVFDASDALWQALNSY